MKDPREDLIERLENDSVSKEEAIEALVQQLDEVASKTVAVANNRDAYHYASSNFLSKLVKTKQAMVEAAKEDHLSPKMVSLLNSIFTDASDMFTDIDFYGIALQEGELLEVKR